MAAMLVVFGWLGVLITLGGILEEVLPKRVGDKLLHILDVE